MVVVVHSTTGWNEVGDGTPVSSTDSASGKHHGRVYYVCHEGLALGVTSGGVVVFIWTPACGV